MSNVPAQDLGRPYNRKVWVVNMWDRPYTEQFRGESITVPPNGEKKVQMGYVEARRFLGQSKPPAHFIDGPNGKEWNPKSEPPKMLKVVELDEGDYSDLGISEQQLKAEAKAEFKDASMACALCGKVFKNAKGVEIHTSTQHPNAMAFKKE